MGNSAPCKIVTPKHFNLKVCTRDYIGKVTCHANSGFTQYSGGFSPNRWNITTLWLFWLSLPYLGNAPRSNRWTDFHALWLKRCVSVYGSGFGGLGQWVKLSNDNEWWLMTMMVFMLLVCSEIIKATIIRQETTEYKAVKYLQVHIHSMPYSALLMLSCCPANFVLRYARCKNK